MNSIENLIRNWDGEWVVSAYDRDAAAWIFIAIHDRTLGMALGGCRVRIYDSPADGLRDALRLSGGMTRKWAAIDFPFGGGKSVIACSREIDAETRERLLLRLGDTIRSLGGTYGTGCDMGTTPQDMIVIGRRTRWVFGRPEGQGGHGDPGPWTARGVEAGMRAACERVFGSPDPAGRTVLIQGVGGVGTPLARRLHGAGARLVLSDVDPDRARAIANELGARTVAPETVYDTECDVFSPCATGGILNADTIGRLRCRIVAGSANNQLATDEDAERLHARGIVYTPDYVVNAGGAIAHAALEALDWTEQQTADRIDAIGGTMTDILAEAAERGESPVHAAERLAARVLADGRRRTPADRV